VCERERADFFNHFPTIWILFGHILQQMDSARLLRMFEIPVKSMLIEASFVF